MVYKLNNRDVNLSGKRIKKVTSDKIEDVYKIRDINLVVYKDGVDSNNILDEETALELTDVPTERILIPKDVLYLNKKYVGFSLKRVDKRGALKKIISEDTDNFIHGLSILEEDVETLSSKNILLNGIVPENTLFNGDLYLTNPNLYRKIINCDKEKLAKINLYQLHLLLSNLIVSELRRERFSNGTVAQVQELLAIKDDDTKSSDFFEDVLGCSRDIRQFVKKL